MIHFEYDTSYPMPENWNETKTIAWINACLEKFQVQCNQLIINFLDDKSLLQVNQSVFNRDYLTDTISMAYQEGTNLYSGTVYISLERVYENAIQHNVSYHDELLRVIIHSVLHIIGYDDSTRDERERMRCLEDLCMDYYS